MISSRNALALALFAGLALAGCGQKQETATATSAPPPATTATSAAVPAPATTSSAVPAPQGATSGAIASTDGEVSGTRIDITELKRTSGGTLNLKFVLVNDTGKRLGVHNEWLGDHQLTEDAYRNVSGVHLIDPVNKKKYFVVTDSEKKCVCSTNVEDVEPGQKVNLWAKFPAPPPDVQKVTIEIPHFQPLDDVQIQ